MSDVVKGKATNISPKNNKDYFGIQLDGDDWFNVEGSAPKGIQDSYVLIELADNGFGKDIRETSHNEGSSSSSARKGGDVADSHVSKQNRITAHGAVEIAVNNAETDYSDDPKKHLAEVRKRSKAYSGLIQDLGKELEHGGGE